MSSMRCSTPVGIGGVSERNGEAMAELTDIAYIKALLTRHGFHFSKKLGQNFLINPAVCPLSLIHISEPTRH